MSELVSIVIPVYNVRPYIEEALNSVINQTYTKLEIIVVDDGSKDGSGKICDRYAKLDSRIIVIHQRNKGLSSARNLGIDRATGQVIAFLDADDAYHVDMIAKLLDVMRSSNADIVVCDFSTHKTMERMDSDDGLRVPQGPSRVIDKEKAYLEVVERKIDTAPWNKIYRADIWNKLRFPDGHVYEGTFVVFDLISRAERIALVKERLVKHRNRDDSICNTSSLQNICDCAYAMEHYCSFVTKHTPAVFSRVQRNRIVQAKIRNLLINYLIYVGSHPNDKQGRRELQNRLFSKDVRHDIKYCNCFVKMTLPISVLFPNVCSKAYTLIKRVRNKGLQSWLFIKEGCCGR